jgi:transcriptional regulator with XRE-family HTH domain
VEEPLPLAPQLVASQPAQTSTEAGLQVAGQVREIRKARHLSQRQLAGRMQVPRTYISKIENGKAIPTLGSLERLASALEVDVCHLPGRDCRFAAPSGLDAADAVLGRGAGRSHGPAAHRLA